MSPRRPDWVSVVAGLVVGGLGVLVLLDHGGSIDLRFDYGGPAVLAALGAVLLATGLSRD